MPLISQPGTGFIHSEAERLDRQLREGDGLVWSGDPRLSLGVVVMAAPRVMQHPVTGKWLKRGDMISKRYEVFRANEDGTETSIGHWRIEEFDKIMHDVAKMKAGFEGRIPDVEARIDANNAAIEKENSRQFHDFYGAAAEHAMRLAHDRNNPQNTFRQMGGSDERPDRNLTHASQ
jgi:hypothetical protein